MKKTILILSLVCLFGCAGKNLSKVCDTVQAGYMKANAVALAAKPTIPDAVWTSCVVPLDHAANDSIVACYRAAASGSVPEMVAALADSAQLLVNDFSVLKGCGVNK
jgi:hypothetical protein